MKKKPTEEAALKSLRNIEENTSEIVGKLDKIVNRMDRMSRLSTALTGIAMLIIIWMTVITVFRESLWRIVGVLIGFGICVMLIKFLKAPWTRPNCRGKEDTA